MPHRHDIDVRLRSLQDIGKIMRSMKNLSYLETRKLGRFLDSQRRVVAGIEAAAQDLLGHHPDLLSETSDGGTLLVLIGAERGFCGNFNEAIREVLDQESAAAESAGEVALITVGTRLEPLLESDRRVVERLPGATAAEEVPAVLGRLVPALSRLTHGRGGRTVQVLTWDSETEQVGTTPLLPPFGDLRAAATPERPYPPRLNMDPRTFLAALIEHYLFAVLHALLFGSLMAEHQQRVRHLEGALQRVDSRVDQLKQRRNLLRQEEITEEIELILLNRA
jgi:F-type H+-transporting ATPase subunit gamma